MSPGRTFASTKTPPPKKKHIYVYIIYTCTFKTHFLPHLFLISNFLGKINKQSQLSTLFEPCFWIVEGKTQMVRDREVLYHIH